MPHKTPKLVASVDTPWSAIQAAQAAVERGEATVAEFDKLVKFDWGNATSHLAPPKVKHGQM